MKNTKYLNFTGRIEINKVSGYEVKIKIPLLPNQIKLFINKTEAHCSVPEIAEESDFELDEVFFNVGKMKFLCVYTSEELSEEFVKLYKFSSEDYFGMENKPRIKSQTHFDISKDEYFEELEDKSNFEIIIEGGELVEE